MEEKKINFAAIEIIRLLGNLELTPKESMEATMKAMHFIIEKGFCQNQTKTAELVSKALGRMTLTSTTLQN